jgi:phosphatidylglycerophosphate synthase
VEANAPPAQRLYYVDTLRAAVVSLVVLHHLAVVYAANVPFYYVEPTSNGLAVTVLVVFELLNQAWFMGFLFLLSGYFVPSSFERKGLRTFLKDRLVRLGIPLAVFSFVVQPLTFYVGVPHIPANLLAKVGLYLPLNPGDYFRFIGPGPLWFVALLLVFDFSYAAWREVARRKGWGPARVAQSLSYRKVAALIFALAAASYLMRILVPLGQSVLFFPTLSYLPEYASFFAIGILAFRGDWLRKVSAALAGRFFVLGAAATLTLFPLALASGDGYFLGRGTWQSAAYVLWDSAFSVGMSLGLVALFRRYFNSSGRLSRFVSEQSYAVYVDHIPIIVVLTAVVMQGLALGPLAKFAVAGVIALPLCFGAAYVLRRIPLVDRVL